MKPTFRLPGLEDLAPLDSKTGLRSFWVIVLLDCVARGIKSVHCCVDQSPKDPSRVWDIIKQEGWMRSIFIQAENIKEAMNKAFERGILVQ